MKNKKYALGLVALLAGVSGLSACNAATVSDNGAVFTYTDAQGNRVNYSAEDLLNDYRKTGSSLSTEFDKIYEVLVRHYYAVTGGSTLTNLQAKATSDVLQDKQTAQTNSNTNKTTYEVEWEKILTNNNCTDADDLFQYHLYAEEKDQFQNDIYLTFGTGDNNINGLEVMRDGGQYTYTGSNGSVTKNAFPASNAWGIGNDGWIKDQMPYHTRHILLKFASAKSNEFTQDKIGESTTVGEGGETTKLADVVLQLAGAKIDDSGILASVGNDNRWTFGSLAKQYSDDTSSAAEFGDNGIVTKVMSSDLIHEYKLGIYAFDSLYNQRETTSTYGLANAYRLQPGLLENATSSASVDSSQTMTDDSSVTVNQFFKDEGIGQIPFGAALALLDNADVIHDVNGNVVNEGNEAFYPRNVIYNKYFNKHNICVITPNAIQMNVTSPEADANTLTAANSAINAITPASQDLIAENYDGVYSSQFGNLPGFQVNTQNILPSFSHNVLTDNDGQVVLAVRGGSGTSYQGIFFISIQRSALSQYGIITDGSSYKEAAETDVKANDVYTVNSPSINDYYTVYTPDSTKYPTYQSGSTATTMTTFVNFNKQQTSDFASRSGKITAAIKAFNTSLSTYQFQMLFENGSISFNDSTLQDELENYSTTKRQSAVDDAFTTWAKNWKEYAELIEAQNQARAQGDATKTGYLISEVCAVGYGVPDKSTLPNPELWAKGGACYYATK